MSPREFYICQVDSVYHHRWQSLSDRVCKEPAGELGGVVFSSEGEAKQACPTVSQACQSSCPAGEAKHGHQMSQTSGEKQERVVLVNVSILGRDTKIFSGHLPPQVHPWGPDMRFGFKQKARVYITEQSQSRCPSADSSLSQPQAFLRSDLAGSHNHVRSL